MYILFHLPLLTQKLTYSLYIYSYTCCFFHLIHPARPYISELESFQYIDTPWKCKDRVLPQTITLCGCIIVHLMTAVPYLQMFRWYFQSFGITNGAMMNRHFICIQIYIHRISCKNHICNFAKISLHRCTILQFTIHIWAYVSPQPHSEVYIKNFQVFENVIG